MSTLFFNFFQKILAKARRRRLYHSGDGLSILFFRHAQIFSRTGLSSAGVPDNFRGFAQRKPLILKGFRDPAKRPAPREVQKLSAKVT